MHALKTKSLTNALITYVLKTHYNGIVHFVELEES